MGVEQVFEALDKMGLKPIEGRDALDEDGVNRDLYCSIACKWVSMS